MWQLRWASYDYLQSTMLILIDSILVGECGVSCCFHNVTTDRVRCSCISREIITLQHFYWCLLSLTTFVTTDRTIKNVFNSRLQASNVFKDLLHLIKHLERL